ncbi:hypothetical protein EJ04DRAFT_555141 [Polyplosphaeria fusca]|uniref:AA1-like domain-containing protein n=1 Tax=Polyplosphaeria fusca TaxID=682080 RepID=A0A9P4UZB9_9PLEO|nr:hypothetical protein EJ04DRAFT_555141 [Polyplosphaeria fusca]
MSSPKKRTPALITTLTLLLSTLSFAASAIIPPLRHSASSCTTKSASPSWEITNIDWSTPLKFHACAVLNEPIGLCMVTSNDVNFTLTNSATGARRDCATTFYDAPPRDVASGFFGWNTTTCGDSLSGGGSGVQTYATAYDFNGNDTTATVAIAQSWSCDDEKSEPYTASGTLKLTAQMLKCYDMYLGFNIHHCNATGPFIVKGTPRAEI